MKWLTELFSGTRVIETRWLRGHRYRLWATPRRSIFTWCDDQGREMALHSSVEMANVHFGEWNSVATKAEDEKRAL